MKAKDVISSSNRLTLGQAGNLIGKRYEVIRYWALSGVAGERLNSTKIGGTRYTTREAFDEFLRYLGFDSIAEARRFFDS